MILFKPFSKEKILAGQKWQTRKLWDRPRARAGSEHLAYLRPPVTGEKPFARILIKRVWKQRLADMTQADALAEGYPTLEAFFTQFSAINRKKLRQPLAHTEVYAVEFQLLERFP